MRPVLTLLLATALLAGCTGGLATLPGNGSTATGTQSGTQSGSQVQNLLNGAILAPKSLLEPGASVISVGGGNVISVGGGNVISVGGGNVISVGGGNFQGVGDRSLLSLATAAATSSAAASGNVGTIGTTGAGATASVAAATATSSDRLAPVGGSLVAVYDLNHKLVAQTKSDAAGKFKLQRLPVGQVLAMRTIFKAKADGKEYYLSTLLRMDKAEEKMPLDPMNTVIEAAFFKQLAGKSAKARDVSMGLLQTLWTHANELDITFDTTELEAARTLDELVRVYEEKVVARFPADSEARATYQSFQDSLR